MTVSVQELAKARGVTETLLDDLELGGYLYELEAFDNEWQVRLDCALDGGWASVTLPVERERLLACADDEQARRAMLESWRERLRSCRSRAG